MSKWMVADLRAYCRSDFSDVGDLSAYLDRIMPESDGHRVLTLGKHNYLHHWTLGLVARTDATGYVHIDAHPDDTDSSANDMITCASFVRFIPGASKVKDVRVIGRYSSWCNNNRAYRDRARFKEVEHLSRPDGKLHKGVLRQFLRGTDKVYLSVDLDVWATDGFVCDTVGWIMENKNVRGADIYPDAHHPKDDKRTVERLIDIIKRKQKVISIWRHQSS
ncbi:MAG: arginase family protein [Candidatus Aenigmatarchaeota archaeon]